MHHLKNLFWLEELNATKTSRGNPWYSIVKNFHETDFIVVKFDAGCRNAGEELIVQLLEDESLHGLIDVLYYEDYVHMHEMAASWGGCMQGSLENTFNRMTYLRQKGIAAHFFV